MNTRTMTFQSVRQPLNGYFAKPDGSGPFPAVLIIHELKGLNENIREITRRFAGEGYAALAVDLFSYRSRAFCLTRFFIGMLTNSLNHEGIQDLKSALNHLASLPEVDPTRIGAVGYCLGGSFAIALACADDRLRVIAPYYAMNPRPMEAVKRLCPVVGSYPSGDVTTSSGQKLDLELDQYNIPHDIKVYPGAKHSFFNDHSPATFNQAASDDSWRRVMAFFKEHI